MPADRKRQRVNIARALMNHPAVLPGTTAIITVEAGTRLSERYFEDSYSYVLVQIVTGGCDEDEVAQQYARYVETLDLRIDDVAEAP